MLRGLLLLLLRCHSWGRFRVTWQGPMTHECAAFSRPGSCDFAQAAKHKHRPKPKRQQQAQTQVHSCTRALWCKKIKT